MISGTSKKGYGLFVPKSNTSLPLRTKASAAFSQNDSDSDGNDDGGDKKRSAIFGTRKSEFEAKLKKQQEIEIEKAISEDPTVFEYDSIYDDLDPLKKERDPKTRRQREGLDRKPKYIEGLLAAAEKRKKDNERRVERKVHAERNAEGDEFADKEQFVTSAYKKKMQELAELEHEERLQEAKEAAEDVTKRSDLTGFYRHMLEKRVEARTGANVAVKVEPVDRVDSLEEAKIRGNAESTDHDDDDVPPAKMARIGPNNDVVRPRSLSSSSSQNNSELQLSVMDRRGAERRERARLDSSSSEEEEDENEENHEKEREKNKELKNTDTNGQSDSDEDANSDSHDFDVKRKTTTKEKKSIIGEVSQDVKPESATKMSLEKKYAKRTVGAVFDAAQKAYLERKLQRLRSGYSVIDKNED